MIYRLPNDRGFEINILLWQENWHGNEQYQKQFQELSAAADYISYNGHAGFGFNVETLERWSRVRSGKYQIYYINGCNTFSYIEDAFKKNLQANQGEAWGQYLDVMANVNPSYSGFGAQQNLIVIDNLLNPAAKRPFYEILKDLDIFFDRVKRRGKIDYNPHAIVIGDQGESLAMNHQGEKPQPIVTDPLAPVLLASNTLIGGCSLSSHPSCLGSLQPRGLFLLVLFVLHRLVLKRISRQRGRARAPARARARNTLSI
jgi:hypothetical protein